MTGGPGSGNGCGSGGGSGGTQTDCVRKWTCGDERDDLAAEYDDPKWPCIKFQSSGGTANFTWSELNGGWAGGNESRHYPYGFVTANLKTGLQATRDAYGAPIHLESGYRCPIGNASLPDAVPTSNHKKGAAVDMWGLGVPWTEDEYEDLKRIAFANGGSLP